MLPSEIQRVSVALDRIVCACLGAGAYHLWQLLPAWVSP